MLRCIQFIKDIYGGKSYLRMLMDERLSKVILRGKVVDIGGGNQRYLSFMTTEPGMIMSNLDVAFGKKNADNIDLEKDKLPFDNDFADQILMLNLLEHIYNYKFLVSQTYRVLRKEGKLIGFVPFLQQYHPDPHDFFRYTKESLKKILKEAGSKEVLIEEVGRGPFSVQFNILMRNIPKFLSILIFPLYYILDTIFLRLRSSGRIRYPLGYFFIVKK